MGNYFASGMRMLLALILTAACSSAVLAETQTIELWHSFRGREEQALEMVVASCNLKQNIRIFTVRKEADSFINDLERSLRQGQGPDLFIWAHDKVGEWAEQGWIESVGRRTSSRRYLDHCLKALTWRGRLMGLPLSFETLILYYNRDLVPAPPATTDEMIEAARRISDPAGNRWGLVYERGNFYHHAMWLHAFGGEVFDRRGRLALNSPAMVRSLEFARDLADVHGIIPDTVDWSTQMDLFNSGRAGMLISGPWAYSAIDLKNVNLGIACLPVVSEAARRPEPFAGVKGFFVSARSRRKEAAFGAAAFLTSTYASSVFNIMAGSLPANRAAYDYSLVSADFLTSCFKVQVAYCRPMPSQPEMRNVWRMMMTDPQGWRPGCLDRVFVEGVEPSIALSEAMDRYRAGAGR